jgi:hypothetical protein
MFGLTQRRSLVAKRSRRSNAWWTLCVLIPKRRKFSGWSPPIYNRNANAVLYASSRCAGACADAHDRAQNAVLDAAKVKATADANPNSQAVETLVNFGEVTVS